MKKLLIVIIGLALLVPSLASAEICENMELDGQACYDACSDISEDGECVPPTKPVVYEGLVPCGRDGMAGGDDAPCQFCHIFILLQTIIDFFLMPPNGLLWLIALLMIVAAGFLYIVGYVVSKDANLVQQANKILTTTLIGLAITLTSWIIINVFFIAMGVADWTQLKPTETGGWFEINCPVKFVPASS